MARARFYDVARDPDGRSIASATVEVFNLGTTTPISETLYADPTSGTTLTNPFTTATDGEFEFYLAEGAYVSVRYSKAGYQTETRVASVVAPTLIGTYPPLAGPAAFTGLITWKKADGTQFTAKPLGDGTAGIIDIVHDDVIGYLLHLHAGPNSGAGTYAIGIGADAGAGGGLLVSAKNAGHALVVAHNPTSSGVGLDVLGYSALNFPARFDVFVGAKPVMFTAQPGAGFADGVANGTTTFTSATAAFVVGDVGATLTQLTSTSSAPSVIPAGTTIAGYVSATQVTLSQAATGSATGMNFLVGARGIGSATPPITQYQGLTGAQKLLKANISTDTTFQYTLAINGFQEWGAGGSAALDTNLYRSTNGRLKSDHQIQAADGVGTKYLSGAGTVTIADGDFLRAPADGQLAVVGNSTDSTARIAVRSGGVWKVGPALSGQTITVTGAITGAALTGTSLRTTTDSGQQIEGRDSTNAVTKFAIAANGEPSFGNDAASGDSRYITMANARARFGYTNGVVVIDDNATNKEIAFKTGGTNRIRISATGAIGFFGGAPVAKPTGVAVTAAGIHAALVALGLIAA